MAKIAGEYLKRGRPIYIEGRLKTRKDTDNDGVENYACCRGIRFRQMSLASQGSSAPLSPARHARRDCCIVWVSDVRPAPRLNRSDCLPPVGPRLCGTLFW